MEYVNISLLEQFEFCPRQAENELGHIVRDNTAMRDGSEAHENRARVRNSFKKTRRQNSSEKPDSTTISNLLSSHLKSDKVLYFSEVYVKSKRVMIHGYIDELQIGKNRVCIIDYKTTFGNDNFFIEPAVRQLRAYALAFKEYYSYSGTLQIIIKRVFLKFDPLFDIFINADEITEMSPNARHILTQGWEANLEEKYNEIYHSDADVNEIMEILNKIRSKQFDNIPNPKKCQKCQYNLSCDYSLIRQGI